MTRGHENIGTTAHYYWTANANEEISQILDGTKSETTEDIQQKLNDTKLEIERLKRCLSDNNDPETKKCVRFHKTENEFDPDEVINQLL